MGAISQETVTGLIFAGGLATRMGGANKALARFEGRPLARYVIERLRPQCSALLLSANRSPEEFASLGLPVIADRIPGHPGPLAALDAAFASGRISTEWVLTAPCDAPRLPGSLTESFAAAQRAANREGRDPDAFVARTGGYVQSTVACIRAKRLAEAADSVASGERRLRRWLEAVGCESVFFPDEEAFANFNSDEELRTAERRFSRDA